MPRWCATVAPGLEPTALDEVEAADAKPRELPYGGSGLVGFEVPDHERGRQLLHRLRTVHRLGPVLDAGRADPEDPFADLREAVEAVDWAPWIDEDTCWALRVARHGDHPFRSVDVEETTGGALDEVLTARNPSRPPVDLEDPDALVRIHVGDDGGYVLWLDLVGTDSLHRRGWKVYEHPAAMKPTLAAGLIRETGWDPTTRLADPTAGGATLPIEAAWAGLCASPVHQRASNLLVHRVPRWRETAPEPGPGVADGQAPDVEPWLVVGDRAPNHLRGARRNLEAAGVVEHARLVEDTADALAEHAGELGAVVANPPYGLRSTDADLAGVYEGLVEAADAALADEGRLGLLTARGDLVERVAGPRGLETLVDRPVHHGRLQIRLMVLAPS